ncbi:hypothetical protein KY284_013206 [Solanum tuberosum]|nr:hypothetical protein KY284_013206 [Solanum tuberosum]
MLWGLSQHPSQYSRGFIDSQTLLLKLILLSNSSAEFRKPGQGFAWGQQWSSSASLAQGVGSVRDTCDPNFATDDSYVATYDLSIATYDTNVATDDSYVATDDPSVATWGDGRCIDAGAGARQDQGATTCRRCSGFLCEKCKKHDEDSIIYLQTLSQTVNEFKNKRGIKVIPSKNVRHPYTPQAKMRKKSFVKAIQNLKKKIFGELPMAVGEEVLEFKHVNVYKRVTIAEKNKLVDLTRAKELRVQYDMHFFSREDFRTMTSMDIWWEDWYVDEILSLMRERHVRYPEYYDSTDRILDLNFYSNFKLRYDKISEKATTVSGRSFTQLINEFEWDEDIINYVRGIRPYPRGMDWIGAKRLGYISIFTRH